MKKILSVSILAVLAVAPLSARAEVIAVPEVADTTSNGMVNGVATTNYVKGAYNALQAPVNNIVNAMNVTDLSTLPEGKTHIVSAGTDVANNLKALDTAVLNLKSSSSDTYVTKDSASAAGQKGQNQTLRYATGNGEAVGANLAALDAQVAQNTDDIGTMTNLGNTTNNADTNLASDKGNVVAAVSKLDSEMGKVSTLTTTSKKLTGAVNELDAELGTITAAAMGTSVGTVSGAINEVKAQANANESHIGTLNDLSTTQKGNLVAAINEVASSASNAYQLKTASEISAEQAGASGGLLTAGQGVNTNLVSLAAGINGEIERAQGVEGTLGNLSTTAQGNLVSAINEVNSKELEVYSGWNGGQAPTKNATNVELVVPTGA